MPPETATGVRRLAAAEIGTTGLATYSGQVFDELTRELQGERWRRVVRAMTDNDPIVGGVLYAIETLVRQVTWITEPASDAAEHVADKEFVEECLSDFDVPFQDNLAEILTMLPWGYSLLEQVFKLRAGPTDDAGTSSRYDDGQIGWAKWAPRSQESIERWVFGPNGQVDGVEQQAAPDYLTRTIPATKLLHFRTTSRKGSPEGRSLLRNAWRPWYFGSNIERIEAIGVERDLAGLPVALVPPALLDEVHRTPAETAIYTALRKMITNIRRDEQEGVLMPAAYDEAGHLVYDLKLLSTGGTRQMATDPIIQRHHTRIAQSMLADFIMLGHEKVGSFALADSKTNLFAVALGAHLDTVCGVINRDAIPLLLRLNGRPTTDLPTLQHGDLDTIDLGALGAFIEKLTAAGITLTEGQKQWVLEKGGLPVDDTEAGEAPRQEQEEAPPTPEPEPEPAPPPPPAAGRGG